MMTLLLSLWLVFLTVVVGRIWLSVFPPKAEKQRRIDETAEGIKRAAEKVTERALQAFKREQEK